MKRNIATPSKLAIEAASLFQRGQFAAARAKAEQAIQIKPKDAGALSIFGLAEASLGRLDSAIPALQRVTDLMPGVADAHFNLACALQKRGDIDLAERSYRRAIQIDPRKPGYVNNLGSLYQERRQIGPARELYETAHRLDPNHEPSVINLYGVYRTLNEIALLERLTQHAIKQWPRSAVHWTTRAEALFLLGRFAEAWPCYEWRFRAADYPAVSRQVPGLTVWAGEDLSEKSVLVWTEQGPGDEIMYASLLGDIRSRVRQLNVLCSARMKPLFERTFPGIRFFGESIPADQLSTLDCQAAVASFAPVLRPTIDAFPQDGIRLVYDAGRAKDLRAKYKTDSDKVLVGIAWKSAGVEHAQIKSINLGVWGALFGLPNVQFVNLQYGDCAKDLERVRLAYGVDVIDDRTIDSTRDLDGFASQVAAMDFVVCSSNTAAHFAGALGVETFCMIPSAPALGLRWYWQNRGASSLFYNSVKLFRQYGQESWQQTVCDVCLAIAAILKERHRVEKIPEYLQRLASGYLDAKDEQSLEKTLRALALVPGFAGVINFQLACRAKDAGDPAEAEQFLDRAITAEPEFSPALNLKGVLLAARGELDSAEVYYRRAIQADPKAFEPLNNLGTVVRRLGRGFEANELYQRANTLMPDHDAILQNLGANLCEIGRPDEAVRILDQLLQIKPDCVEARHSRCFALLTAGHFAEGWKDLWCRHQIVKVDERPDEKMLPRWDGQDLLGKSVLVWTEQGFGDEIWTASMVPDLLKLTRRVTLLCTARMQRLFAQSFPGIEVKLRGVLPTLNLADYDFQMSQSELGAAFRSTESSFANSQPYLYVDPAAVATLKGKYKANGHGRLIGLSWASANPNSGHLKSIGLLSFLGPLLPFAEAPTRARFVNLQYGNPQDQIQLAKQEHGIEILTDSSIDLMADMAPPAEQIAAMDLVVTISNTAAHMAGALGVPTILFLPLSHGRLWYWFAAYDKCLWYPSVQYVFQSEDGTWTKALLDARRIAEGILGNANFKA